MQSCVVYHLKFSNCNGKISSLVKRRRFEENKSGSQKDETCFCH